VSTDFLVLGNYSCDSHFREFAPLLSAVPLTQNSEIIFHEEPPTPIENARFCQNPAIEFMRREIGKKEISIEERVITIHRFGPSTLMDPNPKKGQEQGVSLSILKDNVISYPIG
jgi:hypothetical protein